MRVHETIDRSSSIQHLARGVWRLLAVLSAIAKFVGSFFKLFDVVVDLIFRARAVETAVIERFIERRFVMIGVRFELFDDLDHVAAIPGLLRPQELTGKN